MSQAFSKFNLHPRVMEALSGLRFRRPTPVQDKVIPLYIQGNDLIVEAPTGTGKTAAYGLPLISSLDLLKRKTQALVMAPTRELALQISEALRGYFDGPQLRIGTVTGGSSMEESEAVVKGGYHIVVAVPGRLRDVMTQMQADYFWRDIKHLVMDEGDKLLESGFQLYLDELRKHIRRNVQLSFFSATIPPDAEQMMRARAPEVKVVRLEPRQVLKNIAFYEIMAPLGQREAVLAGLIEQEKPKRALVFCGRREEVLAINNFLRNTGQRAEVYHGMLDPETRATMLARFRDGHIRFLVASDLAARGLDIIDLPAVINLSIPEEYDYYLHRVGRTGRAGQRGTVYNVIDGELDSVFLHNHHRQIGLDLRTLEVPLPDLSALRAAQQQRRAKYHFSRGKQDKVSPADFVGLLTQRAGLAADDIGAITIHDSYSVVDMPIFGYERLMQAADEAPLSLKGKSVKLRRYDSEEQEKRAKAVKKLLIDRKPMSPRKKKES